MNQERPGAADAGGDAGADQPPSPAPDLDAADDLAVGAGGGLFYALLQLQQATAAADTLEQCPAAQPPGATAPPEGTALRRHPNRT
jgi:hypothetical protein